MFTLGTAAKHVGKSKPTISKAIKDGKLSATKVGSVYQIDPSELARVFPEGKPLTAPLSVPPIDTHLALTQQQNDHLEATVDDLKARLEEMKSERDQAIKDAREDRARVMALLEDQRSKSLWSQIFR